MYYGDATPSWYPGGAPLPADAVSPITALADRIWKDPSEPMALRTAVTCLFKS